MESSTYCEASYACLPGSFAELYNHNRGKQYDINHVKTNLMHASGRYIAEVTEKYEPVKLWGSDV